MTFEELREILIAKYPDLDMRVLPISSFVFEERVKQKCFHCKNYRYKWTCPGNLPPIDYKKLVSEYENAAVVICKLPIDAANFEQVRSRSTNLVHKALLYLEKELYNNNCSLALSFIGGSCKLCKNGCSKDGCANPYLSRTPWEGMGCNVVATLKNIGIEVKFPPTDYLFRYGLILW